MHGFQPNACTCYTPHTGTTQDYRRKNSSLTCDVPQKEGNEWSGKEKRSAHRGWPGARCRVVHGTTRHLGSLAARWPHPRCCLDEVSFPAGTKKKRENGSKGKRLKKKERVGAKLREHPDLRHFMIHTPFSRKFIDYSLWSYISDASLQSTRPQVALTIIKMMFLDIDISREVAIYSDNRIWYAI